MHFSLLKSSLYEYVYVSLYCFSFSALQPVFFMMSNNVPPAISHGGKGDIDDALSKVARVCDIPLSPDPSPNIHIGPVTFEYAADLDARFNDRNSFEAALKKYLEEAGDQAKMVLLCIIFTIYNILHCFYFLKPFFILVINLSVLKLTIA